MKKDVLLVVIMIFVLIRPVLALANPSAVYCEELKNRFGGYEYIITSDRNTDSYGLCILPDGTQCEGWDFLKGKCGQEYSYCEQNGNITKTISLNGMEYSICVEPDNRNKEGSPTTVLMGLEDMLGGDLAHEELEQKQIFLNSVQGSSLKLAPLLGGESLYNASDFPEWDWRSPPNSTIYSSSNYVYFDDALGWSTPAKNQGYCGSCWAFSALGAMEAKYNIEQNESRLNPDLSEQHQVSCDEGNGGCHGGMMDQAYDYIISEGVVDEQCFPYLAVDSNGCNADENCTETPILCSDRCLDYTDRLWTLDGYLTRSSWENPTEINVSNEELKQLLIDYGPLSIAVNAEGWHSYSSDGIFGCVNQSYWEQLNHGVVLVGYKDTGILETSYWIIKNSWGTEWGGNGHIKVQFNCSGVGNSVESPYGIVPPEFSPNIVLGNPENETTTVNNSLEFNFTVYNRNSTTSICDLFINNLIVSSAIVTNATQMKMEKTLDLGSYMWNVRCWEQELGIVDISELRTLNIHYPSITINSPENKTYNVSSVNLNFTITGEGNCSYSLDGQANQTIENCENKTLEFLSEGAHYLEMYMTHPEGINSDSVFFTIDTVLPEIALVNPPNQSSLSDRLVEFSFNATDNIAENLTCTLNVNGTVYEINTTNSTQKNYEVELENGDYEW
ncbi:DUF333 domain-containing protein, partial [Candidatus Micrarchaeota archaeon]|nr:DUF333 domain-containing protein [Candidatus Micrarchaeota archaeon]